MGIPILVLGESGTGKSTSLRNFEKGDIAIVNVAGKPLPFKGKFETISGTTEFRKIKKFMQETEAKSIVVDDAQYIMSFQYMRRIKENGWDKFNELQSDFFNLIDLVKDLPDDVVVYFLSHLETKEDGRQKIKTIGKMLDEKITIEGMFTVVLKTYTADGKYYFLTQNSGNDTTKSPMGMFPSYAIDNDLKYVDDKIRNYYELGEFLSDEEMAEIDEAAKKVDVIKDEVEGKKRGRKTRGKKDEQTSTSTAKEAAEADTENDTGTTEEKGQRSRRRRRSENDNTSDGTAAPGEDTDVDADKDDGESTAENSDNNGTGRRRSRRTTKTDVTEEKEDSFMNEPPEKAEEEELPPAEAKPKEQPKRRTRKKRDEEPAAEAEEKQEEQPETPTRRRRRRA